MVPETHQHGPARLDTDFGGIGRGNSELNIAESVHGQHLSGRDVIADHPFRGRQHDQI